MANRVNNWKELLELANKDLEKYDAKISVTEDCGAYSVIIGHGNDEETYAENYYEDELSSVVNEAWAHARAKWFSEKDTAYRDVVCNRHEDGFWFVDARDEDDKDVVIAVINDVTGDCHAIRDLDDKAKGVIDEKQKEIASQRAKILADMYNGMPDAEGIAIKEHKISMTVELTVEAPEANDKEEVEGVVYWKATSDIEAAIGETLDRDVVIKEFNIQMNDE